jgi:predicted enzyme related to lactoylglutathione lyase
MINIRGGNKMPEKAQIGEFCWNELMTDNVEKAKAFYGNLLGWSHQDHDMKDMTYTMFHVGEKMIGGMLPIPQDKKGQIPPHWMSYILVKDLKETVTKAQSLGANIIKSETPIENFGKLAVIQDPTGAYIAFWEAVKA